MTERELQQVARWIKIARGEFPEGLFSAISVAQDEARHKLKAVAPRLYDEVVRLREALSELDTWLHFKDGWGDSETLVPLPNQLEDWRGTLAKAHKALNG